MRSHFYTATSGYTIVELMVSILVVAILCASVGMFFVKLLTLQEEDREEGYIRESLADFCAAYADFMSIGSTLCVSNQDFAIKYRHETGGVSLETGRVTRAEYLKASNLEDESVDREMLDLKVLGGSLEEKYHRKIMGMAALIPYKGDINIVGKITPVGVVDPSYGSETDTNLLGFVAVDSALGYLQISAEYRIKNKRDEIETKHVTAGRLVRLWNRE